RGRGAVAGTAAAQNPRKNYWTNRAYVFYGHSRDFRDVRVEDLPNCARVIAELPPQPQPMSLVDVELWVIRLFGLHPKTQDLSIKGFCSDYCLPVLVPDWYNGYWETFDCLSDESWASFANKGRMSIFILYVDSSEIKHYGSLLKSIPGDCSQLGTVVLPEQKTLTHFLRLDRISSHLAQDLTMKLQKMSAYLAQHYGHQFSCAGAWRAKLKALEMRFGTFYDSYNYAPRLLKDIESKPGSFVDIKDTEVAGCKDYRVLHRIFWAFAECIRSFMCCRPVICVKGTPLCGKYQGVLLTALAFDANDHSIPVAFAVVEGESMESWLWFLRNVNLAVVDWRSDVCIIHDYKGELLDAIEELCDDPRDTNPWRYIKTRWCIEDLAENFFTHFGDMKLVMLFKRLCHQKRSSKFAKIWEELDQLTLKYTQEKERGASEEIQQESVEHGDTEFVEQSPCNHLDSVRDEDARNSASGRRNKITRFSEWIYLKPMAKWSLLYDTNGARYGIMGTNIADLYKDNHVMKGLECLPLSGLVVTTYLRIKEYFNIRSAAAKKSIGNPSIKFPEFIQDEMKPQLKAEAHHVICMNNRDKNVFSEGDFKVQSKEKHEIVYLTETETSYNKYSVQSTIRKTAQCSCNKPKLLGRPCSHVIAVCCTFGVSPDEYMSPYYTLSQLANTFSGKFKVSESFRNYTSEQFSRAPSFSAFMSGNTPTWIPDKKLEFGLPVSLTSDGTHNRVYEEQRCNTESGSLVADNQGTENCSLGETDE
uniref:SWIM-type domain-containing protein n=1 Tax=Oryza brachyantha TaxID=4533 RepID=J3MNJ6_ORYBR